MDKTIKIFVASSNELDYERQVIGNLVRHLNDIYERRGLRIKLDEWEPLDNNNRNTEEYNTKVRESNMYLALLHRQYDNFVIDEFNVARGAENTKPYVYFKEVNESKPEEKLDEFRDTLSETEYFWINFTNRDTLRFHFVMQFHLVEDTLNANDIKVEDGKIWLEGKPFLHANELSFVGSNTLIKKWSERLNVLEAKENKTDDEKKEYFELKDNLQNLQKGIINVAKQMARYHGQRITIRLSRAINAFDAGDIQEVSRILAKAPQDGINALQTYQQATEVQQQSRENVINSIKEIALLATNTMADMETIPSADERVEKAHKLYAQADEMAQAINYDPKEYIKLLLDYANFLFKCGKYENEEGVCLRQITLCEEFYREPHVNTAMAYNNIGTLYTELEKYNDALNYLSKALEICKNLGEEFLTAMVYSNMGGVHRQLEKYKDAERCCSNALEIYKNLGKEYHTAIAYSNIGGVYNMLGKEIDAKECVSKALEIYKRVLTSEHPDIATIHSVIGGHLSDLQRDEEAIEHLQNALDIYERVLPSEHPKIAKVHLSIGVNFFNLNRYEEAIKHLQKALDIYKIEPSKHQESILEILGVLILIDKNLRGAGAPKGGISFKFNK